MDSEPPCAALGLVEQARQSCGFVAVRTNESLPPQAAQAGFDFAFEVLGNDRYQLLHFVLDLPGRQPYDIILNPNNAVVRKVVDVMRETAQYFFFVFGDGGEMTAFREKMSAENLDWFNKYGGVVHTATTTGGQYEKALQRTSTAGRGLLHGRLLHWVCRDDMALLNLQEHRFEMRGGPVGRRS